MSSIVSRDALLRTFPVQTIPGIPAAPTAVQGSAQVGAVDAGEHTWTYTFVQADGRHTSASVESSVLDVEPGAALVTVTVGIGPDGTVRRDIYRNAAGQVGSQKFVGSLDGNVDTDFVDDVADADLGAVAPATNTWRVIVVPPTDLLRFDKKCFTVTHVNAGGQEVDGVLQASPVPPDQAGETDWETLSSTLVVTTLGETQSTQIKNDSRRSWRVTATTGGATEATVQGRLSVGAV